ncbi:protein phosphatase regulator [Kalmusia sp. IMI 367209]|nr:protein phosphatase regulator [Kalmusia sp. IMI 367209]
MEDPYSIAPLNSGRREFRLVELWPSAESESIKCGLRSYSMDEDYPAYVALSYAWGRKERYDDIELNGIRFPVGSNLWRFLHYMRLRNRYIALWIDAICINQSKVLERNHQVQMMRQIYSNAQSVSVWLGEADNSCYSDIAMEYLAARKTFGDPSFKFGKFWSPRQAKGVLALCERNYWRRIWIVQEIMLAKEATIYCGSKNISWHIFEQLVNDLQAISDRGREKHTLCVSSILASPAIAIAKAKLEWGANLQPLATLLQLYHDHEATDIRDKVYALHGLAKDSSAIVIDYHKSSKDLLVEVLYNACASRGSSTDRKCATKELVRFGNLVGEMLRVHCSEDEIKFHVSMASRGPYEEEFQKEISSELASRFTGVPLLEDVNGVLELRQNEYRAPCYECSFWFLNCSYVSYNEEEWKTHCLSHFRGEEPPRSVHCPLCDQFSGTFENGWIAWNHRIEHVAAFHHNLGETLRISRPDFHLFQHLWQKRLIDDQDFKELKGGNHCLARTPSNFTVTNGRFERRRRGQRLTHIHGRG